MLIVIIILGILAAIAMPRYFADLEKAREAEARATLDSIRKAELAYYAMKGVYDGTFPIEVDMDNDGTPEIYLAEPKSPNFTYTVGTGTGKYGKATKITGTNNYYMCFEGGKFATFGWISCP